MKKILIILLTASIAMLASCGKKDPQTNYAGTVTDICGNTYNYVKIGEQYWMAENMRCNKYDTQSERKGAELSTSSSETYAPYYADASNKSLWDNYSREFGIYLTKEQIEKFGLLYSWAAAAGITTATEAQNQTAKFTGNRQGICPNGWHVPTAEEWNTLVTYIEITSGKGEGKAGTHLKTTNGWSSYDSEMHFKDTYRFSGLPSGHALGSKVKGVSSVAAFWSVTQDEHDPNYAQHRSLVYDFDSFDGRDPNHFYRKYYGMSVRCVKN